MKYLIFSILFFLSACSKGPEISQLKTIIGTSIDKQFKSGTISVDSFDRRGSYTFNDNGEKLIIYYKANLKLQKDYEFANWNKPGANSLSSILGATSQGIKGINPEGNKAGDILEVYGTVQFKFENGKYTLFESSQPISTPGSGKKMVSNMEEESRLERANLPEYQRHIQTLAEIANRLKNNPSELDSFESVLKDIVIHQKINVDTDENYNGIVSGDPAGTYYKLGEALETTLKIQKQKVKNYQSYGSRFNSEMVAKGKVRFGIAQSDLLSYEHKMSFGEDSKLMAVMSLYPEVIHAFTLKGNPINTISDLRDKKVATSKEGSGTFFNAQEILASHNINPNTLKALGLIEGMKQLKEGKVDAVIYTGALPSRTIQVFAQANPIKFLSLSQESNKKLVEDGGKISITLPAYTYNGVESDIRVVGTTAVLFTNQFVENERVKTLLEELFNKKKDLINKFPLGGLFSKKYWNKGISIPFHPGAESYFTQQ